MINVQRGNGWWRFPNKDAPRAKARGDRDSSVRSTWSPGDFGPSTDGGPFEPQRDRPLAGLERLVQNLFVYRESRRGLRGIDIRRQTPTWTGQRPQADSSRQHVHERNRDQRVGSQCATDGQAAREEHVVNVHLPRRARLGRTPLTDVSISILKGARTTNHLMGPTCQPKFAYDPEPVLTQRRPPDVKNIFLRERVSG